MSFVALLLILSLVIFVPMFFVMKEKAQKAQLQHQQQLRQLQDQQRQRQAAQQHTEVATAAQPTAAQSATVKSAIAKTTASQSPVTLTLDGLVWDKLPPFFHQLLHEIDSLYQQLRQKNLPQDKAFTVNKLIDMRLPELLNDYAQLDSDYAKTAIVDKAQQLTTQDIVHAQLKSILHFLKTANQDGDQQLVSNILASRHYLNYLYDDSGLNPDVIQQQQMPTIDELTSDAHSGGYVEQGHRYLNEFYQGNPDVLSQAMIYELGRLVFLSDNTLIIVNNMLDNSMRLDAFDRIVCDALPALINALAQYADTDNNQRLLRSKQTDIIHKLQEVIVLLHKVLAALKIDLASTTDNQHRVELNYLNEQANTLLCSDFFDV